MNRNNRPATADTVKCPMCAGHGTLERAELVSRLNDREFNRILQNYIDEMTYGAMQPRDLLAADSLVNTHFEGNDSGPASASSTMHAPFVTSIGGKH